MGVKAIGIGRLVLIEKSPPKKNIFPFFRRYNVRPDWPAGLVKCVYTPGAMVMVALTIHTAGLYYTHTHT